tara:strand:+ start:115 stop:258 length:144 start_codon:yes stop_codon:yes gene_type:complete
MRQTKLGGDNPAAKKIIINNIQYNAIKLAMEDLNLTRRQVKSIAIFL